MRKRYFRWKVIPHGTDNVEWTEMNGKEYYHFVIDPQNKDRHFIDMGDIVLECTVEKYREFKAEDDHSSYILEQEDGWVTLSIDAMEFQDGLNGEEILSDATQSVEEKAITRLFKERLKQALCVLSRYDRWLIESLYLQEPRKTLRQLSSESGIPVMTLQNRKKKVLVMLRISVLSEKI